MSEPSSCFLVLEEKARLKDILNKKQGIPIVPTLGFLMPFLSLLFLVANTLRPLTFLWLLPDPENVKVQSGVHRLHMTCFVPSGKPNASASTQRALLSLQRP